MRTQECDRMVRLAGNIPLYHGQVLADKKGQLEYERYRSPRSRPYWGLNLCSFAVLILDFLKLCCMKVSMDQRLAWQ
jgi:hypothetical protein